MSRHRADRRPRFGMLPSYRPSHCAGVTESGAGCLHEHADEYRCKCGQVTLSAIVEAIATTIHTPHVDSLKFSALPTQHAAKACRVIPPAALAMQKAGA